MVFGRMTANTKMFVCQPSGAKETNTGAYKWWKRLRTPYTSIYNYCPDGTHFRFENLLSKRCFTLTSTFKSLQRVFRTHDISYGSHFKRQRKQTQNGAFVELWMCLCLCDWMSVNQCEWESKCKALGLSFAQRSVAHGQN